jgi:hypothetical protein
VSLTASDVAVSQLGQFALYDGRNNSLIASVNIPVVYPVATNAILFDSKRNRLYLTTGASPHSVIPRLRANLIRDFIQIRRFQLT